MRTLIVGGGISGVSAAKVSLAGGHEVTIVESSAEPGGLMARIANCRVGFKTFLDEIIEDPRLSIIKERSVVAVERKGDRHFLITLDDGQALDVDSVIIAAGLTPFEAVEYKGRRVMSSLEYDAMIDQRNGDLPSDFNKVAFVLCVGSRSQEYPLCSSVCCSYTIREIKWTLQRAKPAMTVFYNDLRLFGQEYLLEQAYRDAGVDFVRSNTRRFDEDDDGVTVRYFSGSEVHDERFDYVVLSMALRPNPDLKQLSTLFGFSLNDFGFVKEEEPLTTDAQGIYVAGGSLEPMNIKDAIMTGFGAGMLAVTGTEGAPSVQTHHELLWRQDAPQVASPDRTLSSCLLYLGTDDPANAMFYEFLASRFISLALALRRAGTSVFVVTKNMVTPSYGELRYEEARRQGVVFVHLEEGETLTVDGTTAHVSGLGRELAIDVEQVIFSDDYLDLFADKEFLSVHRSEPQLRWSPDEVGEKEVPRRLPQASQRRALGATGGPWGPWRDASRRACGPSAAGGQRRSVQRVRVLQGRVSSRRDRDPDSRERPCPLRVGAHDWSADRSRKDRYVRLVWVVCVHLRLGRDQLPRAADHRLFIDRNPSA